MAVQTCALLIVGASCGAAASTFRRRSWTLTIALAAATAAPLAKVPAKQPGPCETTLWIWTWCSVQQSAQPSGTRQSRGAVYDIEDSNQTIGSLRKAGLRWGKLQPDGMENVVGGSRGLCLTKHTAIVDQGSNHNQNFKPLTNVKINDIVIGNIGGSDYSSHDYVRRTSYVQIQCS